MQLHAQKEIINTSSLDLSFGQGLLLPEYQFINYLANDYTKSFDISYVKHATGKTDSRDLSAPNR